MPEFSLTLVLQVIVASGLLNVWLLRAGAATDYRGGDSETLRDEFAVYGLSSTVFFVVGTLKIASALSLLVGLWVPALVLPAAAVVLVLMTGAVAMHVRVGDPIKKYLPASAMLLMSAIVCMLAVS